MTQQPWTYIYILTKAYFCFIWSFASGRTVKKRKTTPQSEPERQLLVPYSTKANAFCELGRKKIGKNEPCSPQKAFAFVEYGTRSCLSASDSGVFSATTVNTRERPGKTKISFGEDIYT